MKVKLLTGSNTYITKVLEKNCTVSVVSLIQLFNINNDIKTIYYKDSEGDFARLLITSPSDLVAFDRFRANDPHNEILIIKLVRKMYYPRVKPSHGRNDKTQTMSITTFLMSGLILLIIIWLPFPSFLLPIAVGYTCLVLFQRRIVKTVKNTILCFCKVYREMYSEGNCVQPPSPKLDPIDDTLKDEFRLLKNMGFVSDSDIILALKRNGGNIVAAIAELLKK